MSEIVPRWEWRTFGESFGAAEDRLEASDATRVVESEELYVVSSSGEASIKVRGGQLDVKRLEQVGADGLEQWRPVAKADFPIAARELASFLGALATTVPALDRDAYELDELVDEVVRPRADLLAVGVRKRRLHFAFQGCRAELTDVHADGRATRTLALESEDPARLRAAVDELGLGRRPNVSFPRGLAALVGFGARRYAVVDVGTNSVKLHLAERAADGSWRQLVDRAVVTRLGEGLRDTGTLQPAPSERTIAAIEGMVDEARAAGADEVAAVGTAGLRAATNSADFVEAVGERCGVRVEVISGEEEARLAFLAATAGIDRVEGALVVFETGGGSTQFTFGHHDRVEEQFSVPVGAVRLTEQFGLDRAVGSTVLGAARDAIRSDLAGLDARPMPSVLVALGGAVTNLAAVSHGLATYDAEIVQGSRLDVEEIDRLIELFRARGAEERRAIVGLQPARAEVILAGTLVVRTVLEKLGAGSLTVSDRGLRHRLLVERFGA